MAQDEFLEDDLDDQKTVEYIKNTLPQDLKDKYTDDILYYILDVINDYSHKCSNHLSMYQNKQRVVYLD